MLENPYENMSLEELGDLYKERELKGHPSEYDTDDLMLRTALMRKQIAKGNSERLSRYPEGSVGRDLLQLVYTVGSSLSSAWVEEKLIGWNEPSQRELLCNIDGGGFPVKGQRHLYFVYFLGEYIDRIRFLLDAKDPEICGLREEEDIPKILQSYLASFEELHSKIIGDYTPFNGTEDVGLGEFVVQQDLVAVDPCRDLKSALAENRGVRLESVPGTWKASATVHYDSSEKYPRFYVNALDVHHPDYEDYGEGLWEEAGRVDVDTAQAGFYCSTYIPETCPEDGEYPFFEASIKAAEADFQAGITEGKGVVSRTGIGDGLYTLYVIRNHEDKVCRARIVYIDDEGVAQSPGYIMFTYIFRRFAQLIELEDGWAGEGSKAPTEGTLKAAHEIALNAFAPTYIFPTKDGRISMYRVKKVEGKWERYVGITVDNELGEGIITLQDRKMDPKLSSPGIYVLPDEGNWADLKDRCWEFTAPN